MTQDALFLSDIELADQAADLKVTDQATYDVAADALRSLKGAMDIINGHRDNELRPILASADAIRGRYADELAPLEAASAELKGRVLAYRQAASKNDVLVRRAAGTTASTHWNAEVTDLRALAEAVVAEEVPLRLLKPNQVELNKLARKDHDDLKIPGVTAVSKQSFGTAAH